ncbi:MAG TPA: 30S ribosomal protein S20 [Gammaproteobacteria bacterium]|nr:30S ribosomal protein S20 [Gammaproteobacteria bacterium]
MANSKQALKRARQNEKHRQHNAGLRSRMRTSVKAVRRALQGGDAEAAASALRAATPLIDGMVGKGLIHANKAARYKSRLNTQVKRLATGEQAS